MLLMLFMSLFLEVLKVSSDFAAQLHNDKHFVDTIHQISPSSLFWKSDLRKLTYNSA